MMVSLNWNIIKHNNVDVRLKYNSITIVISTTAGKVPMTQKSKPGW